MTTRLVDFDEWLDRLLDRRVTTTDGTSTRFDLTRAVASALPVSTSAVPLGRHARQLLVTDTDWRVVCDDRRSVDTSQSLLELEERMLGQLVRGIDAGAVCGGRPDLWRRWTGIGADASDPCSID